MPRGAPYSFTAGGVTFTVDAKDAERVRAYRWCVKTTTRRSYRRAKETVYWHRGFEIIKSHAAHDRERWFAHHIGADRLVGAEQPVGGYFATRGAVVRAIDAYCGGKRRALYAGYGGKDATRLPSTSPALYADYGQFEARVFARAEDPYKCMADYVKTAKILSVAVVEHGGPFPVAAEIKNGELRPIGVTHAKWYVPSPQLSNIPKGQRVEHQVFFDEMSDVDAATARDIAAMFNSPEYLRTITGRHTVPAPKE